jgi:acyl-CoA synthetase (AMP-forming)/AMP-acid ligase II
VQHQNRYQRALLRHFQERPEAVFCRQVGASGTTAISWRALEADCGRFGAAYRGAGLAPGDQALIFLRHAPELYGAFFGAMLTGVTPAFMPCSSPRQDPRLYWSSHQALIDHIRPAAIVTDRPNHAEMAQAGLDFGDARVLLIEDLPPAPLEPYLAPEDAIALLQHSSGTTGLKKGVALSHGAVVGQIESYARAIALDDGDVIVSWLPLYHDMGLIACLVLPAYFAIPITHIDPFHWLGRPQSLFEEMASQRGTLTWLPNFAFEHLAATARRHAASFDLSGMRAFINCSEVCKPATFERFAAAFADAGVRADQLQCCYAMAETVFAVTQTEVPDALPRHFRADPASLDRDAQVREADEGVELMETGAVIEGLEVTIRGEAGELLGEGRVGEIAVSGDFLFSDYNHDPQRTAEQLRNGVYFSRDLGFVLEGRLFVLGRIDDLIIINGRNLYAHEVEAEVNRVAGVKAGRAVAVGWFDPRVGSETLVVMAERAPGSERADAAVKHDISQIVQSVFNVAPRAVELVDPDRLIKTTSGKISRRENLARLVAGLAS